MTHLSIKVLGELSVSKADSVISSFESDKARALLAYLAVEADRSHHRKSLAGLFWPDYSEQTALHNLSQGLFNLRKAPGDQAANPSYLLITRDAIQFNRECDYSLDQDQFNTFYSSWEKSRDQEAADIRLLEDLVGLYWGEFLQSFYLNGCQKHKSIFVRSCAQETRVPALDFTGRASLNITSIPQVRGAIICLYLLLIRGNS